MKANTVNHSERYMLKGSLRKNGFDRWRIVTSGSSAVTGEERTFFVEFCIVNPALSPQEYVLGFKNRFAKEGADLQYALAGTEAARSMETERLVQPSFVMVKAGVLGPGGRQMNAYFPSEQLEVGKNDLIIKVGGTPQTSCMITSTTVSGSVNVSEEDLAERPELLGQAGRMSWNLTYRRQIGFSPDYRGKALCWSAFGARTGFEGRVTLDGEEFVVTPKKSLGYMDKNWGRDYVSPFFHISAANFTSIINGKNLENSCVAVQGVYNERLSVLASVEGSAFEFHAGRPKKYALSYDCTEMPADEDGVKLHWVVSANDKRHVVDIDIYCDTSAMFLRDYESPEGGRKVLKVLGGGTGTGELRIYKRIKKNLELVEHVRIANAVCEYGHIELPSV